MHQLLKGQCVSRCTSAAEGRIGPGAALRGSASSTSDATAPPCLAASIPSRAVLPGLTAGTTLSVALPPESGAAFSALTSALLPVPEGGPGSGSTATLTRSAKDLLIRASGFPRRTAPRTSSAMAPVILLLHAPLCCKPDLCSSNARVWSHWRQPSVQPNSPRVCVVIFSRLVRGGPSAGAGG